MSLRTLSWRHILYYGEAVGVVLAWIVGVMVALDSRPTETASSPQTTGDRFAAVAQE